MGLGDYKYLLIISVFRKIKNFSISVLLRICFIFNIPQINIYLREILLSLNLPGIKKYKKAKDYLERKQNRERMHPCHFSRIYHYKKLKQKLGNVLYLLLTFSWDFMSVEAETVSETERTLSSCPHLQSEDKRTPGKYSTHTHTHTHTLSYIIMIS